MKQLNQTVVEYQTAKREIIGFNEISKEREERLEKLKSELGELKVKFEELDLQHGTLSIQYDKVKE